MRKNSILSGIKQNLKNRNRYFCWSWSGGSNEIRHVLLSIFTKKLDIFTRKLTNTCYQAYCSYLYWTGFFNLINSKSNQMIFLYSIFHADSEYNIFKKFNKIYVIEFDDFCKKKRFHICQCYIFSHSSFDGFFQSNTCRIEIKTIYSWPARQALSNHI